MEIIDYGFSFLILGLVLIIAGAIVSSIAKSNRVEGETLKIEKQLVACYSEKPSEACQKTLQKYTCSLLKNDQNLNGYKVNRIQKLTANYKLTSKIWVDVYQTECAKQILKKMGDK